MAYAGFTLSRCFQSITTRGLLPEPGLMKEVSIGGLKRTEDGRLQLTYTGKPPEACPT